ncbi:hypothetical protein F441_05912 [Phytophthora nicotianae CJ01A1]|uniref:Uncharacterized protein n=1 Tax=Phytophthora nicotianae CJ01A1 TaxID=1317063 RepID=W2XCX2_PHYNI|nr:hypothetical protein F441_05912 [Phytophthora nicotianae CJ01A1]
MRLDHRSNGFQRRIRWWWRSRHGDFDTYAKELGRWALYDYSGIRKPLSDDEMRSLFHHHQRTRSKPVAVMRTVTLNSLDNAWTSFANRWNTGGATRFIPSLERREAEHEARSVSALARRVHKVAYDADRGCCYVHYTSGYTWCSENGRPRPSRDAWEQEKYQVSEAERELVGQYRRAMSNVRRGGRPRHPEDLQPLESLPRRGHHYQQVVQGRHAGTVQRDQREEAEAVRSRQRAMERLSRLEREMAELRRELEEPPRPERGNHD